MKPPRRSCVDHFLKISTNLRNEVFNVIENFHLSLGNRFDNMALASQVRAISLKMREEMVLAGPLGGFIFDINLYNLWTLLKNYKTKQRAQLANRNACAFMAPFVTRFIVDRMLFTMDRIVWTAPCSGLVIPRRLACAIFRLAMDVRKKTSGNCKFSGRGRKQLMSYAKEMVEVFQSLDDAGILGPDLKRFFQLHCRFTNIERLLIPVQDCCAGREPNMAILNSHWFQRRDEVRAVSRTAGPVTEAPRDFDNPLLLMDEEGNVKIDVCDLSPLLPCQTSQSLGNMSTTSISTLSPGSAFITQTTVPIPGQMAVLNRAAFADVALDANFRNGTGSTGSFHPHYHTDMNTVFASPAPSLNTSSPLLQFIQLPLSVTIPPLSPLSPVREANQTRKRKSDAEPPETQSKVIAFDPSGCSPRAVRVDSLQSAERGSLQTPERKDLENIEAQRIAGADTSPFMQSPGSSCSTSEQTTTAAPQTLPSLPNLMDLAEIENSGDFHPLPTDNLTLFSECDMSPDSCATLGIPAVMGEGGSVQPAKSPESLFLESGDVMTEEEKNYIIDDELNQILFRLFETSATERPMT